MRVCPLHGVAHRTQADIGPKVDVAAERIEEDIVHADEIQCVFSTRRHSS